MVLLGATGYTGRLAADAMVRAGLAPVLAGRSADAVIELVGDLAGLGPMDTPPSWAVADVEDPASVRALVTDPGDVLVSTVGPFTRLGRAAVDAAVAQGCAYVDSTGEPAFVRTVFEADGPRAAATGARLLPAFGYDFLPGNLAGALAIAAARAAGLTPSVVQVGYFTRGAAAMSSGTRASVLASALEPPVSRRAGVVSKASAPVLRFEVDGRRLDALPVGGSEVFALPRQDDAVRDVEVGMGWAGKWTGWTQRTRRAALAGARLPVVGRGLTAAVGAMARPSDRSGPDAASRAQSSSLVVARACDGVGRTLVQTVVTGPNGYTLTADALAWAAAMLRTGRHLGVGALGPADAFGLAALVEGCAAMGLTAQTSDGPR